MALDQGEDINSSQAKIFVLDTRSAWLIMLGGVVLNFRPRRLISDYSIEQAEVTLVSQRAAYGVHDSSLRPSTYLLEDALRKHLWSDYRGIVINMLRCLQRLDE